MRKNLFLLCLILVLALAACGTPTPDVTATINTNPIFTYAVETISARLTQQSSPAAPSTSTQSVIITVLVTAPFPIEPPPTPIPPTETPSPPPPTETPLPPTPTLPRPCNAFSILPGAAVGEGATFTAGAEFTQVWQIENTGTCTWTSAYKLAFIGGEQMGSRRVSPLPAPISPGEVVEISLPLAAPDQSGDYRGFWMLRDQNESYFGGGEMTNEPLTVGIRVVDSNPNYVYDFAVNYCAAAWNTDAGELDCPSERNNQIGFTALLLQPDLEIGRDDEPALWVRPNNSDLGWISGVYPPLRIQSGDHFRALVGCLADNPGCNVTFRLEYMLDDGRVHALGSWLEVYDDSMTNIDLDLTPLAGEVSTGQSVQFILTVEVNSNAERANAVWFVPRIARLNP